eukprot:scaffold840_cov344-Pavlova_lutheri.AAC.15
MTVARTLIGSARVSKEILRAPMQAQALVCFGIKNMSLLNYLEDQDTGFVYVVEVVDRRYHGVIPLMLVRDSQHIIQRGTGDPFFATKEERSPAPRKSTHTSPQPGRPKMMNYFKKIPDSAKRNCAKLKKLHMQLGYGAAQCLTLSAC